ncbi:LPXTG cell wall anchor domain-containing protein [Leucobacter luti]|uniref:LPXTG cell wall anchor domain-containing protein n=1 Tax=Leucobacter luti TaxID=340320 RepID=UPI0014151057|nr:LPXTG cell wall anchor domain-containing protein [Leucobacter luti]
MNKKRNGSMGRAALTFAASALVGVSAFAIPTAANAAPGDAVTFGSSQLKGCVNESLNQAPGDMITEAQASTVRTIDCRSKGVTSIEGLQKFTNLERLNLLNNTSNQDSPNLITDLSPLQGSATLTVFSMEPVSNLDLRPLSGNTGMEMVELWGGSAGFKLPAEERLTSLRGLETMNLYWLNVNWQNISDLTPLANMTNMVNLELSYNNISDISPLTKLTELETLRIPQVQSKSLSNNAKGDVTDISVLKNMPHLFQFYADFNNIEDFTALKSLRGLSDLSLWGVIPNFDFGYLKTSEMNTLTVQYTDSKYRDGEWGSPRARTAAKGIEALADIKFGSTVSISGFDINTLPTFGEMQGNIYLRNNNISDVGDISKYSAAKSVDLTQNLIFDASPVGDMHDVVSLSAQGDSQAADIKVKAGERVRIAPIDYDGQFAAIDSRQPALNMESYDPATGTVDTTGMEPGTKFGAPFIGVGALPQAYSWNGPRHIVVAADDLGTDPENPGTGGEEGGDNSTPETPAEAPDDTGAQPDGDKKAEGASLANTGSDIPAGGIALGALVIAAGGLLLMRKRVRATA